MDSRLRENDGTGPRGNDGVFLSGVGVMGRWIPAFAGMTEQVLAGMTGYFFRGVGVMGRWIPAFAGMTEQVLAGMTGYFFRVLG